MLVLWIGGILIFVLWVGTIIDYLFFRKDPKLSNNNYSLKQSKDAKSEGKPEEI